MICIYSETLSRSVVMKHMFTCSSETTLQVSIRKTHAIPQSVVVWHKYTITKTHTHKKEENKQKEKFKKAISIYNPCQFFYLSYGMYNVCRTLNGNIAWHEVMLLYEEHLQLTPFNQ